MHPLASNFRAPSPLYLPPVYPSRPPPPSAAVPADCDLYHGRWVPDPLPPLYTNATCRGISQHQNCQGNGRPDSGYERWQWKPNGCDLPRFDAREFARLMRRKSILFVGDSVARNQMESLVCLLSQVRGGREGEEVMGCLMLLNLGEPRDRKTRSTRMFQVVSAVLCPHPKLVVVRAHTTAICCVFFSPREFTPILSASLSACSWRFLPCVAASGC